MKTYTVGMLRERLAAALDDADAGRPVFIERRGVMYRVSVEPAAKPRQKRTRSIDVLDPAIDQGSWSWDWSAGRGLRLQTRRRRR